jgi:hypothetical protein
MRYVIILFRRIVGKKVQLRNTHSFSSKNKIKYHRQTQAHANYMVKDNPSSLLFLSLSFLFLMYLPEMRGAKSSRHCQKASAAWRQGKSQPPGRIALHHAHNQARMYREKDLKVGKIERKMKQKI